MKKQPKQSKFRQLVRRVNKGAKRGLIEFGGGLERFAKHYNKNEYRIKGAKGADSLSTSIFNYDPKFRNIATRNVLGESLDKAFTKAKKRRKKNK